MTALAICPYCKKTTVINVASASADKQSAGNSVCSICGHELNYEELRAKNLLIDAETEAREFALAKNYFANTEFMSAMQHFEKALAANRNSYLSQYFVKICEIYINETSATFDVMGAAIETVKVSLELLSRSGVTINDKLTFITAMLNEIKIIIINKLRSDTDIFETDIEEYRKRKIFDLQKLLALFKTDGELMMTYSPAVTNVLLEIADNAIAVCHKTVQTVAIGEDLHSPTKEEYRLLSQLDNDYSFFATSYASDYDARKYTPDFEQNTMLIDKVNDRLAKYDAKNRANAKKFITGDIEEYEDIIAECEKAVKFTYLNCFKSLCDPKYVKRKALLKDGLVLLYRILTPRVTASDKKKYNMYLEKFVFLSDKFEMLSKFLDAECEFDNFASGSLRAFYQKLYDIVDMYFVAEYDKYSKIIDKLKQSRDEEFSYYEKFLYNTAVCCASALTAFVSFDDGKDKNRAKIVKICKQASEEFLMLWDYKIGDLEQSNIYRPILDIYNAVLKECDE